MTDQEQMSSKAIENIKLNHFFEYEQYMQEIRFLAIDIRKARNQKIEDEKTKDFFNLVDMMKKKFSLQQIDMGINTCSIAYDFEEMKDLLEEIAKKIKL